MTDNLKKQLTEAILENADQSQKTSGASQKGSRSRKKITGLVTMIIIALLATTPLLISQSESKESPLTELNINPPTNTQIQPAVLNEQTPPSDTQIQPAVLKEQTPTPPSFTYTGAPGFQGFVGCSFTRLQTPSSEIDNQDQHEIQGAVQMHNT